MTVIGFDDKQDFRLKAQQLELIKKIVDNNKDIYDSPSHFIRSWIIRGIKHYDEPRREQANETDAASVH